MGQDRVKASGFLPSPCVSQELLTSWEPLLWKEPGPRVGPVGAGVGPKWALAAQQPSPECQSRISRPSRISVFSCTSFYF